jgi:hypothetical protein
MLYKPEAFEPLTDEEWNEQRARERIRAIVADAERGVWPEHDLYSGAAGVIWALDTLRRRGYADLEIDLAAAATRTLELWPESEDIGLFGEAGVSLVAWRLAPSDGLADRLLARVRENKENETNELLWGAPGTMIAARAMHDWTGDQRWLDAWNESAEELLRRRDDDGLWTQTIHGHTVRYLGPAHGAVGNVVALGDDPGGKTRAAIERKAVVEDGLANWPAADGWGLERNDQIRIQWCHGAAGIVTSMAAYLDEELLLAGAELTWRAGPHQEKGGGLCHGTAGNGYAFLKTFERTGDEQWLERARRFAMHALGQVTGRYSLFTGDVGIALYAADCIDARAAFPILDTWD